MVVEGGEGTGGEEGGGLGWAYAALAQQLDEVVAVGEVCFVKSSAFAGRQ